MFAMEEKKTQEPATTKVERTREPKRTNKSWEAFRKSQGTVIVNGPTLLR